MPALSKDKAKRVADAESGFPPLDEGIYVATLVSVEDTDKAGKTLMGPAGDYWKVTWGELFSAESEDWDEAPRAAGHQFMNLSLSDAAEWKLNEFFTAFGVDSEVNTDELIGEQARLVLSVGPIEKGPRMGQLRNNIDQVLPLHDAEEEGEEESMTVAEAEEAGEATEAEGEEWTKAELQALGRKADADDEEAIGILDELARDNNIDPDEYDTWLKLANALAAL